MEQPRLRAAHSEGLDRQDRARPRARSGLSRLVRRSRRGSPTPRRRHHEQLSAARRIAGVRAAAESASARGGHRDRRRQLRRGDGRRNGQTVSVRRRSRQRRSRSDRRRVDPMPARRPADRRHAGRLHPHVLQARDRVRPVPERADGARHGRAAVPRLLRVHGAVPRQPASQRLGTPTPLRELARLLVGGESALHVLRSQRIDDDVPQQERGPRARGTGAFRGSLSRPSRAGRRQHHRDGLLQGSPAPPRRAAPAARSLLRDEGEPEERSRAHARAGEHPHHPARDREPERRGY